MFGMAFWGYGYFALRNEHNVYTHNCFSLLALRCDGGSGMIDVYIAYV
jgi:hypothetical protein